LLARSVVLLTVELGLRDDFADVGDGTKFTIVVVVVVVVVVVDGVFVVLVVVVVVAIVVLDTGAV